MFHVKHILSIMFLFQAVLALGQNIGNQTIEIRTLPNPPSRLESVFSFVELHPASRKASSETKEWLYWINYSRVKPVLFWDSVVAPFLKVYPQLNTENAKSLKRNLYASVGLGLLSPDSVLAAMASAHSLDVTTHKASPSHTSTNGKTFQDRMTKAGILNCAGENISFGDTNTLLGLIFLYIDEGIPGVGHRKTLLNPDFISIGVGVSKFPDGSVMVVQDFACDQSVL